MSSNEISRQQEILNAAQDEFIREGVTGARTQSIADNVGVTKAMIHYYFKNKDTLFREVFKGACESLTEDLLVELEQDRPLFQKIEQFIDRAFDRFEEQPRLTGFIINELNNHAELTRPIFTESLSYNAGPFEKQLEEAASNYEIAPVKAEQVIANIFSLCILPHAGRRFLQSILDKNDEQYASFLQKRKEVVKDTVMNWMTG